MRIHQIHALLIMSLLSLATMSSARTESTAHIVETHPESSATLGRQESFWVRIEYATDEGINLWARPYRNGVQVKQTLSNASSTYTGSGETLGWFSLIEPGDIDEIRIIAGGGKPYREWELARQPAELRWTNSAPSSEAQAQWVTSLLASEQVRRNEEAQRRAKEPVPVGDIVLFNGFMLAVLALFVACLTVPLWSAWKWRGGWRTAAAVPAVMNLYLVLRIAIDTSRDPTSHNLWPLEIVQFGILSLFIIGALKLARRRMAVQQD